MKNEKKYPNYVGKKMKGFKFEIGNIDYVPEKSEYIGKVGEIINQLKNSVKVEFEDNVWWYYPIDMVEEHLVEEELMLPKRGDEILVWDDDEKDFRKRIFVNYTQGALRPVQVVSKYERENFKNGKPFYTYNYKNWKPFQKKPTYTHRELEEKIGEEFIYKND